MEVSEAGLRLIKSFEGVRLGAYQDGAGVWTVGYGHTGADVRAGLEVTQALADEWLRQDVRRAAQCVTGAVHVPITQAQFDALVSFCFNLGGGTLRGSTLLQLVNARQPDAAQQQFGRWTRVNGAVSAGLVRRRAAEAAMFGSTVVAATAA